MDRLRLSRNAKDKAPGRWHPVAQKQVRQPFGRGGSVQVIREIGFMKSIPTVQHPMTSTSLKHTRKHQNPNHTKLPG